MTREARKRQGGIGGRYPFCAAVLTILALAGSSARAGDYHTGATLRCNQCHVMHFSQQHGYFPTGGAFRALGQGPNRSLLRNSLNDLCLSCHDGSPLATDVLGPGNAGSQAGVVRLAGYLNRIGISGQTDNGHTLDSLEIAPGSQPTWKAEDENGGGQGLTCTNCHVPHGNASTGHPTGSQYRNLRDDPGTQSFRWVTYNDSSPGVNDFSRDVFVRVLGSYDETDVEWNEPDPTDSAIARWCGGCHSFMHGNSLGSRGFGSGGGSGILDEHPVFDEDMDGGILDQYNTHTNRVKVMSEVGFWNPAGTDVTPTCVSCHRSHGNGNPDGLIYRSGSGIPTEDGDSNGSTLDNLCTQCHVEGSAFSG